MSRWLIILSLLIFSNLSAAELEKYCTASLAEGNFHKTDCSVNSKFENKTYCFGNKKSRDIFLEDPKPMLNDAIAFYEKNKKVERTKLSQEQADLALNDPDCDLSNRDLGYLNFNGKDLTHCIMVNTSFFGADLRGANFSGSNLQKSSHILFIMYPPESLLA